VTAIGDQQTQDCHWLLPREVCAHAQEGSKILFVPGPNDPGPAAVLPRPPLSSYFTEKLAEEVRKRFRVLGFSIGIICA